MHFSQTHYHFKLNSDNVAFQSSNKDLNILDSQACSCSWSWRSEGKIKETVNIVVYVLAELSEMSYRDEQKRCYLLPL